jgi:hypothetical protein
MREDFILFYFIFPLGENIKKNEDNIKTRILKTPGKQKSMKKISAGKAQAITSGSGLIRAKKNRKKKRKT